MTMAMIELPVESICITVVDDYMSLMRQGTDLVKYVGEGN